MCFCLMCVCVGVYVNAGVGVFVNEGVSVFVTAGFGVLSIRVLVSFVNTGVGVFCLFGFWFRVSECLLSEGR